jgi:hypothetical protein
VLTWLHKSRRDELATHPQDDMSKPELGVFSTRATSGARHSAGRSSGTKTRRRRSEIRTVPANSSPGAARFRLSA